MSKKRKNSRSKGKRGELQASKFLSSLGFPCERAARNGVKGGGDIICPSLGNLHIEVKNTATIDLGTKELDSALIQAIDDARGRFPVVLWKRARTGWRLTCQEITERFYGGGFTRTFQPSGSLLRRINELAGPRTYSACPTCGNPVKAKE